MMHELETQDHKAVFVTWTYDDEHLPANASLSKRDFQLMVMRLRKVLYKQYSKEFRIRYFACGEYGDLTHRPHYHAIIFGLSHDNFCDKTKNPRYVGSYDYTKFGADCVIHGGFLASTWDKGRITVGFSIFEGAAFAYVSGYIQKKLNGRLGKEVYDATGREPPFQLQSQGIGKAYVLANADRIRKTCEVFVNSYGDKHVVPRYYRKVLGIDNAQLSAHMEKYEDEIKKAFESEHPDEDIYTYDPVEFRRRQSIVAAYNASLPADEVGLTVSVKDVAEFTDAYLAFKVELAKRQEYQTKRKAEMGRTSRSSLLRHKI